MARFVANVYLFFAVVGWAVAWYTQFLPWMIWCGITLLLAGNLYGHVWANERKRA